MEDKEERANEYARAVVVGVEVHLLLNGAMVGEGIVDGLGKGNVSYYSSPMTLC